MKQQLPFSSHKVTNALTVEPMQYHSLCIVLHAKFSPKLVYCVVIQGLLMYDSEKRFCKDAWRAHQQLQEREALNKLMTAADAQEAVALETLTKVADVSSPFCTHYFDQADDSSRFT